MDTHYESYDTAEFLLDDSFVDWVKDGRNDQLWQGFLDQHPHKKVVIEQARSMILAASETPGHLPDEQQVGQMAWCYPAGNGCRTYSIRSTSPLNPIPALVLGGCRFYCVDSWLAGVATIRTNSPHVLSATSGRIVGGTARNHQSNQQTPSCGNARRNNGDVGTQQ